MPTIHAEMIQPKGAAYRTSQIHSRSHYLEPIRDEEGRLAGNSRIWGDASPEVQSRVIDLLIETSRSAGLNVRDTAHVLAIARIESGFNPDAAAGTTSASGIGQFIDDTGRAFGLHSGNRFDADAQTRALVAHFVENRELAARRGQGEAYIYKYHHDGPKRDYGGLSHAETKVLPLLESYTRFVERQLHAQRGDVSQDGPSLRPVKSVALEDATVAARTVARDSLREGDQGPDVRALQTTLAALGFNDARGRPLDDDGRFGARTGEAVRAFQQAHGLEVDGIVGTETRRVVEAASRDRQAISAAQIPVTDPTPSSPLDRLFAAARSDDPGAFRSVLDDFSETAFGRSFQATQLERAADVEPQAPIEQDAPQR